VQLFTILILVTLPIIFMQFYSTDSHALMSGNETPEPTIEAFFEQITLPESEGLKPELLEQPPQKSEVAILQKGSFLMDDEMTVDSESTIVVPLVKHKKVRLVKGKRHTQGMNFLSVILMLKEKQK